MSGEVAVGEAASDVGEVVSVSGEVVSVVADVVPGVVPVPESLAATSRPPKGLRAWKRITSRGWIGGDEMAGGITKVRGRLGKSKRKTDFATLVWLETSVSKKSDERATRGEHERREERR